MGYLASNAHLQVGNGSTVEGALYGNKVSIHGGSVVNGDVATSLLSIVATEWLGWTDCKSAEGSKSKSGSDSKSASKSKSESAPKSDSKSASAKSDSKADSDSKSKSQKSNSKKKS